MKSFFITIGLLATLNILRAQSPNTFTATNAQITDTLISSGRLEANCIHATDTIVADQGIISNDNLRVAGDITLTGNLIFDAANSEGLKYIAPNTLNNPFPILSLGKTVGNSIPWVQNCPTPGLSPWFATSGGFISTATNPTNQVNSGLKMYSAGWNGFGYIEVEGVNEVGLGNNALEINYFCGRSTHINKNTSLSNGGGWVRMGNQVSMDKHVEIGDPQFGITNAPNNEALSIFTNSGKGIVLKTYHPPTNLINVLNTNSPNNMLFTLRGDGVVQIGKNNQAINVPLLVYGNSANEAFEIRNPVNEEINFKVKTNGFVYAREVEVTAGTFPDYVFDANYDLIKLGDLEQYIINNKRLPGFKNADYYINNGIKTSEMLIKQQEKIEELTLYIIELNKKLEAIEAKVK